nr:reverse transcriptase domain-containing protein [Tanacetum cinerariifolium]
MTTHSAGRGGVTPRGGRTYARRGRGGGRDAGDNGDVGNNGNDGNGNGGGGEDNNNGENNEGGHEHGNLRNGDKNNGNKCSYKEFLACQPKEFDVKGGALAYTRWVEKMELVIDMSNCAINQRVKEEYCPNNEMHKLENEFWNHTMMEVGHAAYTDQFYELAKLVLHLVIPESKRIDRYICGLLPKIREMVRATDTYTIKSAIFKAGGLTYDAVRNGLLNKGSEKRKDGSLSLCSSQSS